MTEHQTESSWQRFWNTGGWWRSLLLVTSYYVLYQLGALVFIPLVEHATDPGLKVFFGVGLPILLASALLVAFAASIGALRGLFSRQPITGSWWMWIAVAVVLLFNTLHFLSIDYRAADGGTVLAWLLTGLLIGFAEETLTRGFVVNLLRQHGYREIAVATLSSALFAAMHLGNMLGGQPVFVTLVQLGYTFGFGICMYLTLRVTRSLIWPILLHATTDPSIFLQTEYPSHGALATVSGLGNIVVIFVGLVLLSFVRGKVSSPSHVTDLSRAPAA